MELWKGHRKKKPCERGFRGLLHQQIDRGIATLNVQRQHGRFGVEDFAQIGDVFHRLLVSADDDVAFLEANLRRRVPLSHY
jgi:hypothetical protein